MDEMALAELTLRPLAERAAVSVATLKHHFGNKQALLGALIAALEPKTTPPESG